MSSSRDVHSCSADFEHRVVRCCQLPNTAPLAAPPAVLIPSRIDTVFHSFRALHSTVFVGKAALSSTRVCRNAASHLLDGRVLLVGRAKQGARPR